MSGSGRRAVAFAAALVAGVATAVVLFVGTDATFSRNDAIGSAVTSAAGILMQLSLLQYPLLRVAGRRGWLHSPMRDGALAAFVFNLPLIALLFARDKLGGAFAPGEALLFAIAFSISAAVFGALFSGARRA